MQNAGTTGRPLNFLSLASKAGKQGCGCTSTHSRVGDDPARTGRTVRHTPPTAHGHALLRQRADVFARHCQHWIADPGSFCESFTIRFRSHSI